jgi:hypothetical protein
MNLSLSLFLCVSRFLSLYIHTYINTNLRVHREEGEDNSIASRAGQGAVQREQTIVVDDGGCGG